MEKNKLVSDHLESQMINLKRDYDDKMNMEFFAGSDRKAKLKLIDRKVEEIMNTRNVSLYERRQK
jgi:hypothetical protein